MATKFSMKKHFLANTPAGSWVKVFISAVLLQFMNGLIEGHRLFTWDKAMLEKLATAGLVALIPVIINFLNPNDTRYGVGEQTVTK
jgi:uncharacterized membrane protein